VAFIAAGKTLRQGGQKILELGTRESCRWEVEPDSGNAATEVCA
jgi:hypothetical protein